MEDFGGKLGKKFGDKYPTSFEKCEFHVENDSDCCCLGEIPVFFLNLTPLIHSNTFIYGYPAFGELMLLNRYGKVYSVQSKTSCN